LRHGKGTGTSTEENNGRCLMTRVRVSIGLKVSSRADSRGQRNQAALVLTPTIEQLHASSGLRI